MSYDETVAPHAGAWIETLMISLMRNSVNVSRPTWARGLKQLRIGPAAAADDVVPHAGAWIEISITRA